MAEQVCVCVCVRVCVRDKINILTASQGLSTMYTRERERGTDRARERERETERDPGRQSENNVLVSLSVRECECCMRILVYNT